MEMKEYLIETFKYNDYANRKVLERIKALPEKKESIRFFSHLINSMNKWMARILQDPNAPQMDWWEPVYAAEDLGTEWSHCLQRWINFLENKSEKEIFEVVSFVGFDGGKWEAKLKDIALQLNYHSIHHRAQIQTLIRQQGFQPDFVDYIGTVYRKTS